jgi:hypothetical protein
VGWCESYSRDAAKAATFYSTVFGVTTQPMPGGMDYRTIHVDGGPPVAGIMQMTDAFPKEMPSVWGIYFGVANADEAVEKVVANGGKVLERPMTTPYGRIAFVADPFGAMFRLRQAP